MAKTPYLCLDDLKGRLPDDIIKPTKTKEQLQNARRQRKFIERKALSMHSEALQKQAAAKRAFLENKKNLDLRLKQNIATDEEKERLTEIQKCMDRLYNI